jgi:endonuclease/exonuclease/phosphatase family metal-dependent hydrolase
MTMIKRLRIAALIAPLLLATACALPHEMEPVVAVASGCPGTVEADANGLHWYGTADDRDRGLAAEWCATVGDPVVELDPAGTSVQWAPGAALQVISWNMQIGGGDLYRMLSDQLGVDCTAGPMGASRAAPFVVLLQEVWRYSEELPQVEGSRIIPWTIDPGRAEGEDPDIVDAARRCGLALVYVPSARNGPDTGSRPNEDKGNAILSNVPLGVPLAIDLPLEGGRKVAVAATVQAPGGQGVRVVSAHLDVASTLVRTVLSGNQTRVRQAMGLVGGLARAEQDGYTADATIVGADMNTWAGNEATLTKMREAFPQSPAWDGLGTRGPFPTDHIFFRARDTAAFGVEGYERVDDAYSSDHHARRMELRFRSVE